MNLIKEILNIRNTFQEYVKNWYSGDDIHTSSQKTKIGVDVTPEKGLSVVGVWACIGLIADMLSMLPLHVYKTQENGRTKAREHNLYELLKNKPNSIQTAFEFKRFIQIQVLLWGAGFAEIVRNSRGVITELFPIPTYAVSVKEKNKKIVYIINLTGEKKDERVIRQENMFCIRGLNSSIFEWKSPITVHRETVGFDLGLRDFGSMVFGQGTNPSAIISATAPLPMNIKDKPAYAKALADAYAGLANSQRLMVLDHGYTFQRVAIPPEDAQYIETKAFTLSDLCRIYRVPLHLVQYHEKSTTFGTGLEEMNNGFLTFTLQPYLVQWEQEIKNKLFIGETEYYAEFSYDSLLRAKLSDRYQAYSLGKQWGFLSTNDIHEKENLNPVEGGNIYWQPLNMADSTKANEIQTASLKKDQEKTEVKKDENEQI